jgi:hypothetical protein
MLKHEKFAVNFMSLSFSKSFYIRNHGKCHRKKFQIMTYKLEFIKLIHLLILIYFRIETQSDNVHYSRSAEKSSSSNNTHSHSSKPQNTRQGSSHMAHSLKEEACEKPEPSGSNARVNGFVEKPEEDVSVSSQAEVVGRGRYMGGRGRGRRGGYSNMEHNEAQIPKPAPETKAEDLGQRQQSPNQSRSSSERNSQSFDERRSPSAGPLFNKLLMYQTDSFSSLSGFLSLKVPIRISIALLGEVDQEQDFNRVQEPHHNKVTIVTRNRQTGGFTNGTYPMMNTMLTKIVTIVGGMNLKVN